MFESLRGQYLIAGRHLEDPNFFRTVVLLVEDNEQGTMGFVVNRPTDVEVRQALEGHFEVPELDDPVFYGGPVEPSALFVLHNLPEYSDGEVPVLGGLYLGNSAEMFERIVESAAAGAAEMQFRIFAGCAGWGPSQLKGELDRGDWHVVDAESAELFESDPYMQWERLLNRVSKKRYILPDYPGNPEWN
ncbi:YqgE/AlgH family protein [Calycomorphotria hydatis]|uniref:UPF0301 protein V22_29450 n=1 Tax=Calycomorphotria hydatis TaxID=2528027 RepID=A0A517TBE2_9PLAN|nr:YqgE/AlgH family protein [Calycomorphotria hydatis]QDT65685.1 hypothetical protein V22_29450 [Calycomorphotria hydatis]